MSRQMVIGMVGTLVVIASLAGVKYLQISKAIAESGKRQPPPIAVTTAKAAAETWPVELHAVGELAPVQGAVLAAEELGRVSAVLFQPGAVVKQGEVLVELDASVEQARLKAAEAAFRLAGLELKLQEALRADNANALADLEKADAAYRAALAEVENLKAQIARKRIIAPFGGRTGARLVNEGQVIAPGTQVVSLQDLSALYLNFGLAQRFIDRIQPGFVVEFSVDAFPNRVFSGRLTTIEPSIDEKTRNVRLQATIANSENALLPGMFARVRLVLPESEQVISIPASSINFAPYGDTVYVVETMKGAQGEYLGVRRQVVKLGRRRGDLISIISGLKSGENVASSGAFELRPGAAVLVNNSTTPGAEKAPTPADT